MTGHEKRMDRIAKSLTPRQAVLAWIAEARRCESYLDYVLWMRKGGSSLHDELLRSMVDGIRESLKKEPRRTVDEAVVKGIREFAFLLSLRDDLDKEIYRTESERALSSAGFSGQIYWMRETVSLREDHVRAVRGFLKVYPLHIDDAAAVTAWRQNRVVTFSDLETLLVGVFGSEAGMGKLEGSAVEENPLVKWVRAHFVEQGRATIPLNAYLRRVQDQRNQDRPEGGVEQSQKELSNLFGGIRAYRDFASWRDFSFGLADVRNTEFLSVVRSVLKALQELVASGSVKAAAQVILPSVPPAFLRHATLIEGDWIDRHVVELAEFGALLADHGFTIAGDGGDRHPLAWPLICAQDGSAVDASAIRAQAAAHMSNFGGRSISIDGRPYLSMADYQEGSQRKLKGELRSVGGFLIESFDQWVDRSKSRGAELAGVKVAPLHPPQVSELDFAVYLKIEDSQTAQDRRRESINEFAGSSRRGNDWVTWRNLFRAHAKRILTTWKSLHLVQDKYFAGHQILLKSSMKELELHVEALVMLAIGYDNAARKLIPIGGARAARSPSCSSELLSISKSVDPIPFTNSFVTFAKAEALNCTGRPEAASKLMAAMLDELPQVG